MLTADNFILNGGFEVANNPNLPDAWGDGGWGIRNLWQNYPNKWRELFRIDKKIAFEGKNSLRIENRKGFPKLSAVSCYLKLPRFLKGSKTWLLSAMVKGPKGARVRLDILNVQYRKIASKEIELPTDSWHKISLKFKLITETIHARLTPLDNGAFNIDAVSLTKSQLPVKYTPSMLDAIYLKKAYYGKITEFQGDSKLSCSKVSQGTVKLENRTLFVDNKPFICYALGIQYPPSSRLLKSAASIGFNTINFYYSSPQKHRKTFAELRKNNLCALPWIRAKNLEKFTELIKSGKAEKSLLAYYIIDEPHNPLSTKVLNRRDIARKWAPKTPIMVNYRTAEINKFRNRMVKLPGDIISADQYPIGNIMFPGSLYNCASLIKEMDKELANTDKAVWNAFQITGNAFMNTREPTPAEYEGMLYSSLIAGCRGFYTFQNQPFSKDLWITAGRVGKEFNVLTPVIYSIDGQQIVCSSSKINFISKSYKGFNYLICVNASADEVKVKFNFPAVVEVVFEKRNIKNGSDEFKPHARHIYRWAR